MIRDQIQVQRDHSESAGPLVTALARVTKLRHCDAACLQCMMIPVPRARPGPAAGDLGTGSESADSRARPAPQVTQ